MQSNIPIVIIKQIGQLFTDFFSLIYPRICPGCNGSLVHGEQGLCTICKHELSYTNFLDDPQNALASTFYGRLPLENVFSYIYFFKGGIAQSILHELKYKGNYEIGVLMGEWFGRELRHKNFGWDVIVPVPLHPQKLKKRGYNQSEQFAKGLANILGISLKPDLLQRHLQSETQTHKSKMERWENVKDNFSVTDATYIKDRHVLLVDDVITTGSTIEACGNVLLNSGVSKLSVIALAMAR